MNVAQGFAQAANAVAQMSGRPATFIVCCTIVLAWAATGPLFGYSDTWQLLINTGTTIVTFLMVFLIQNTQNRDGVAIQTKLDELIRVSRANNRYVGIERLTEDELENLRLKCEKRAELELKAAASKLASARRTKRNGKRNGARKSG
jgi:low affinity Fe/Cu permease